MANQGTDKIILFRLEKKVHKAAKINRGKTYTHLYIFRCTSTTKAFLNKKFTNRTLLHRYLQIGFVSTFEEIFIDIFAAFLKQFNQNHIYEAN